MTLRNVYNVSVRTKRDVPVRSEQLSALQECFKRSQSIGFPLDSMILPVYQEREGCYSHDAKKIVGFQVVSQRSEEAHGIAQQLCEYIFPEPDAVDVRSTVVRSNTMDLCPMRQGALPL